jgi:hypothetical protein
MTMLKTVTIGNFTLSSDGTVIGPADYMRSVWYDTRIASIEAGTDAVYNYAVHEGHDPASAILVSLQTNYGGFPGLEAYPPGA